MYQALYRKYRPRVFADVVGQPQVTKILAGEVAAGRLSHAYLFTGSRGTGKTTCARIFAKAVNCLHPQNGDPCGECEICRGIDNGSMLDYSELDAASNRSIEDIRRIREEAWMSPAVAKYRIFVLDEVHMLTNEAFNALLKILEEPPEHVIFILATTDVQKLPGTVLSRCQRFDFVRIDAAGIAGRLIDVAKQENRTLTPDGAALIAGLSDGAMRDALSILDRCMSEEGVLDAQTVSAVTGMVGRDALFSLADAIAAGNTAEALRLVGAFHRASCDGERLCRDLLEHFRGYMIAKTVPHPEEVLVCTREDLQRFCDRAANLSMDTILYWIDILSDAGERLKKSANGRIEAEMTVIRLCSPRLSDSEDALRSRIAQLEQQVATLSAGVPSAPPAPAAVPPEQKNIPFPEPVIAADTVTIPEIAFSQPVSEPVQAQPPVAVAQDIPDAPPAPPADLPFDADDDTPMPPADLPFDADDDPPMPPADLPFAVDDDPPMPPADLPFEADDDPPMPPADSPFEADDDPPMPPANLPFDADDDPPMPPADLPFDVDDDPPMPPADLPFDIDDDPPMPPADLPFDAPTTSAPQKVNLGGAVFARWGDICARAKAISPPLHGLLDGSSAVENGDTLILSSPNPLLSAVVAKSEHMVAVIQKAAEQVTGRTYRIKFP